MRIARATTVALTAFLAGAAVLEVVAMFAFVGYGGTSWSAALLYSALPVVILSTTFAVLQAQRSLANADWRQAVMAVPRGKAVAASVGIEVVDEELGRLPASHWGPLPEPSPAEEQIAGMKAQLPHWSDEQATWAPAPAEVPAPAASLPKRRAGAALQEATARQNAIRVELPEAEGEDDAFAAAVKAMLQQVQPGEWAQLGRPAAS